MAYDGFGLFGPGGFPVVPSYPFFQQPQQLRIPQDPNVSYSASRSLYVTYPVYPPFPGMCTLFIGSQNYQFFE